MSIVLKEKVIVITGGSSGIGALLAQEVAKLGATPVLLARSLPKLTEVASKIEGKHGLYQLDVTSTEQVFETIERIIADFGQIDILVNNAGYGIFENVMDMPLHKFIDMMDVNYMGTIRCTKAVLPYMMKQGSGHIINIASMAGKIGTAKGAGYAATKHAVLGFTNSLRQELIGTGVKISAINPGPINTPFFDIADPSGAYVKNIDWFILQPEQVVKTIIKIMRNQRAEKDTPLVAGLGVKLFQLAPGFFNRFVSKMINKK